MIPTPVHGLERMAVQARLTALAARLRLGASRRERAEPRDRSVRVPQPKLAWRTARAVRALVTSMRERKYVRFGGEIYFDAFSPRFPSPWFERLVETSVRGFGDGDTGKARGFIPYVVLAITDRCMYRCEHCYAVEVLGKSDSLTLDQWKTIADRFQQIGAGVIAFEGGEPLLRFDDLVALTEHVCSKSDPWIATTGFGLTPSKAKRLAEAGLVGAAVSLDHYDPDRHNEFRGNKKAYDEAIKSIALFGQAGIFPALTVCATREMLRDDGLRKYVELAYEVGAGVVQVLDPVSAGNYRDVAVGLSVEELREIQRIQREMNTSPRDAHLPPISPRATLEYDDGFGCGAGGNWGIYVNPKGELQPCPYFAASTGNLATGDFGDAYARMRRLFPRPPAVGVQCPLNELSSVIAVERLTHGKGPVPSDATEQICAHFAHLPAPALYEGRVPRSVLDALPTAANRF